MSIAPYAQAAYNHIAVPAPQQHAAVTTTTPAAGP
jgi:hypothetical protein